MPPVLGAFGRLGAKPIVVDLADKLHAASAAFWNVFALNPKWYAKQLPFVLGSLSNYLNNVWVVLLLAVQELEVVEPQDVTRPREEFGDNRFAASCPDIKSFRRSDEWSCEPIGRCRNR